MPVIHVEMWPGRTHAQKKELAKAITDAVVTHHQHLARGHDRHLRRRAEGELGSGRRAFVRNLNSKLRTLCPRVRMLYFLKEATCVRSNDLGAHVLLQEGSAFRRGVVMGSRWMRNSFVYLLILVAVIAIVVIFFKPSSGSTDSRTSARSSPTRRPATSRRSMVKGDNAQGHKNDGTDLQVPQGERRQHLHHPQRQRRPLPAASHDRDQGSQQVRRLGWPAASTSCRS